MAESKKQVPDEASSKPKQPLNLNDLASNPMRVGMARLSKQAKGDLKQKKSKKKHWWSR